MPKDPRTRLPAVGRLLERARSSGLLDRFPRAVVVEAIRGLQSEVRGEGKHMPEDWMAAIEARVADWRALSLRRVINATGVVLHTNLGRAPLSAAAKDAAVAALEYSTLELDLDSGGRGSRQAHIKGLISELTGAEDSLVTVNAASALMLVLNTLAEDENTVISRGELIEIGGSFRLPEIIAKSGSRLVEVGTTNRTHLEDYRAAADGNAKCILKVHRSNFVLQGFVCEAGLDQLSDLCSDRGIPLVHDVGSGLLVDLSDFGLSGEPMVGVSVKHGAVTIFSGDKLLGGPQAGIIAGPRDLVSQMASNPLARAVRPDKVTLSALEATLKTYRDRDSALAEIPVLRMLTEESKSVRRRANRLKRRIPGAVLTPSHSSVGGGAFPHAELPTTLVTVAPDSCDAAMEALRSGSPPVIARILDDRIAFDPRTVSDDEIPTLADAIGRALQPK